MSAKKRDLSETIVVECDSFMLKVVTTRRSTKQAIVNKIKYTIPGDDAPMGGEFESGHQTIVEAVHTITLTPGGRGETTTLVCDGDELNALIVALRKALPEPTMY